MADTALKTEEEKLEYFDDEDALDDKIDQLVEMIKEAKHFVTFTGAGLSVGAGIPDYRSGAGTVNKTGAGCWEKKANIEKARKEGKIKNEQTKVNFNTTIQ